MLLWVVFFVVVCAKQSAFLLIDETPPIAFFGGLSSFDSCFVLVSGASTFILNGTSIVSVTANEDLLSFSGSVLSVAVFNDPRQGIVVALADSTGGISFASMKTCSNSYFTIEPTWAIAPLRQSSCGGNSGFTSVFRSGTDEFVFANAKASIKVGWVQGVHGLQLGPLQLSFLNPSSCKKLQNLVPKCRAVDWKNRVSIMLSNADQRTIAANATIEIFSEFAGNASFYESVGGIFSGGAAVDCKAPLFDNGAWAGWVSTLQL